METRDIANPIAEADFRAQAAQDIKESAQHSQQHTHAGSEASTQICPACNGAEYFISQEEGLPLVCGKCNGTGKLQHA